MQHESILDSLLRLQLSSDATSALYLPSVLSALSPIQFSAATDSQIHKWATRITSLIQSKDSGARWTGICLAKKSAELKRELVTEYAQRWINLTLPLLSKSEPPPVWRASIDLLVYLFVTTNHLPEFRRQVSTPTVPKFSLALLELLQKSDISLKNIIASSLDILVSTFPTLHRALTSQILSATLHFLAGSFPPVYERTSIQASAHLLASLHHTDGKVGAPIAWRNTLESAMFEAWKCIGQLQGTKDLNLSFTPKKPFEFPQLPNDPLPAIEISLQRLNNMIILMDALFRVNPHRPVLVPVADLSNLALHLLRSTEESVSPNQDATRLQLEKQVVPQLVMAGCDLTSTLAPSLRQNLTPHATSFISCFIYHLEQPSFSSQRIDILSSLTALLDNTTSHAPTIPSRLFRVVMPLLSPLLPEKRAIDAVNGQATGASDQGGRKGKGKNRSRAFEGEEVLNGSDANLRFSRPDEVEVILRAVDLFQRVLQMPYLPASLHSIGTRVILGLHAHLLVHPPSFSNTGSSGANTPLSQLLSKLIDLQSELSLGTAGYASRGLPLTISMLSTSDEDALISNATRDSLRTIDSIIHPRLPPALRHLPQGESLMLWRKEEGKEEKEERSGLGLVGHQDDLEVEMVDEGRDVDMDFQPLRPNGTTHAMEVEQEPPITLLAHTSSRPQPQDTLPTIEAPSLPSNSFGTFGAPFETRDIVAEPPSASLGPVPSYVQPTPSMPIVVVGSSKPVEDSAQSQRPVVSRDGDDSDEDIPSIDMGSDSE